MDRGKVRKGIRPHGSGIQIDFVYEGKRHREKISLPPTEANLKKATRIRESVLNDIAFNRLNLAEHFPNRKSTAPIKLNIIGKALDDFLRAKTASCAVSTVRDYKSAIEFHLKPIFGELSFNEVNRSFIINWLSNLSISLKRKNNILIPLREVFEIATRDGVIASNPVSSIENFRHKTKEPSPFTPNEVNRILASCTGQVHNLFKFAFYSGLRTSELIALTWDDIDLSRGVAFIRNAKVRKILKSTKTESGQRTIKLFPFAKDALEDQKQFRTSKHNEVFLNPKTSSPWIDDAQIRKTAWYPTLLKANVPKRNPYQTRHTYASLMLTAGEEPFGYRSKWDIRTCK